jgi:isocitrate/isopropylmalate dehydrogenase
MADLSLALIPGDGIGIEVMESAKQILGAVQTTYGVTFAMTELDWSFERYHRTGAMMPADGLDVLGRHDASTRTADLGGTASTGEVSDFVATHVSKEGVGR